MIWIPVTDDEPTEAELRSVEANLEMAQKLNAGVATTTNWRKQWVVNSVTVAQITTETWVAFITRQGEEYEVIVLVGTDE